MPHSHHLALVQGSSSSKPWADNGPFQAAWCLQPAGALAMVSLPGVGSALAPHWTCLLSSTREGRRAWVLGGCF